MNALKVSADEQRTITDGPFCWQSKATIWRIREAFDESTFLDQVLAVYLTLCELASDEQSATFTSTRRKIAERSGVSIRRVSEILGRFKLLRLVDWKQNYLEGTKELAPSSYSLTRCTTSTRLGTPRSRLGTDKFSGNCTVVEEHSEKSPEESPERSIKGSLASLTANPKAKRTAEVMQFCMTVLGEAEMKNSRCHKLWLGRAESNPTKLQRVLADTAAAARTGEINTTAARYAQHRWKEFAP